MHISLLVDKYDPRRIEPFVYEQWLKHNCFLAGLDKQKKTYVIVIPPPNITGNLHLGHALNNILQDILVRFKRMSGYDVLWLPGMDHAGIATQLRVEAEVAKEGLSKEVMGQEVFCERIWQWKDQQSVNVRQQWHKLGLSLDYSREQFTLSSTMSKIVRDVFISLYKENLIYRGRYMVNWDPVTKTALSDIEVEHKDTDGQLYFLRYDLIDEHNIPYLEIATTRPETIFGDVAVAVHPDDERYKDLIGKHVLSPLFKRKLPIIADEMVDPQMGSGVLKITPAHDFNDFEIGQKHKLAMITVMDEAGNMTAEAGSYQGLTREKCRSKLVINLQESGILTRTLPHKHTVGYSQRTNTVVEPRLSTQWFLKMRQMADHALKLQQEDAGVCFIPRRYDKTYRYWLTNIRDWCLSRQLWWGHPIPAFYCVECEELHVEAQKPSRCRACSSTNFIQDKDVLDTWFSSSLWPFATMGWPDEQGDYDRYYPTDAMVTGYDILYFWIARMIFMSLRFTKKLPFKDVLITGLIRDAQGKKMSKSLGNGIDPTDIVKNNGSDALRLSLISNCTLGQDLRFRPERLTHAGYLLNKLWNASRFVLQQNIGFKYKDLTCLHDELEKHKHLYTLADEALLYHLQMTIQKVATQINAYEFNEALKSIEQFFWHFFCDIYIELAKKSLQDEQTKQVAQLSLLNALVQILRLFHPFAPHVTEEIWQQLVQNLTINGENDQMLTLLPWPVLTNGVSFVSQAKYMDTMIDAVRSIRNLRAEIGLPIQQILNIHINLHDLNPLAEIFLKQSIIIASLANVEVLACGVKLARPAHALTIVLAAGIEIFILFKSDDLANIKHNLQKQLNKMIYEVERIQKKLKNQSFVSNAPKEIVEAEQKKGLSYEVQLAQAQKRWRELINDSDA